MYESFYQLSANPFRLTPDPKFCFSHPAYQEAHAYLQYAYELGEGFILLTGRPGAGKTTLIESFLSSLEMQEVVTARIAVSDFEATDLLRTVAYFFDLEAEGVDKATLLRRIEQFFVARRRAGWRVLLVIDEAQRLSHASLEELRLLADLQVGIRPLLQIFLVGQETLRALMAEPTMEQLQQRVIGTCRLDPLGIAETRSYVEHRLRRANWCGDPELTGAAVLAVYEYSKGVPRHINKICTRLLLQGYMECKHVLDQEDVHRIATELGNEQLAPLFIGKEDQEVADAALQAQQHDASSLAKLAIRASEPDRRRPAVPAALQQNAGAGKPGPDMSVMPAAVDNVMPVQSPGRPAPIDPGVREARRPPPVVRTRSDRLPRRGLAGLLASGALLSEKPAVLFGVLAVATLSAGILTSFFEGIDGTRPMAGFVQPALVTPQTPDGVGDAITAETVAGDSAVTAAVHQAGDDVGVSRSGENATLMPPVSAPEPVSVAAVTPVDVGPTDAGWQVEDVAPRPGRQPAEDSAGMTAAPEPAGLNDNPAPAESVAVITPVEAVSQLPREPLSVTASDLAALPATVVPPVPEETKRGKLRSPLSGALSNAERALKEDRLLIPAGNSAFDYYQQALALDPANTQALKGISRIVARYAELAGFAIEQGNTAKAGRYIARGLRVRPGDRRLSALQDNLKVVTSPVAEPAVIPAELPPPRFEESRSPGNLLQRLKAFFVDSRTPPASSEPFAQADVPPE